MVCLEHSPEVFFPELFARRDWPSTQTVSAGRRRCVRAITFGGAETAAGVVEKQLQQELNMSISRQTISRALQQVGMHAAEKQKKSLLSNKNIRARIDFAMRHQRLNCGRLEASNLVR